MKLIKAFSTEAECVAYLDKHNLDNAIICHDPFSGKYEIHDMDG